MGEKLLKVLHLIRDLIYGNSIHFNIYLNSLFWFNVSKRGMKKEERKKEEDREGQEEGKERESLVSQKN